MPTSPASTIIPLEDRPVDDSGRGRRRHVRDIAVWLVAVLITAYAAVIVAANPAMRWDSIGKFLTAPIIIQGLGVTILLTVASAIIGFAGGLVIALMRMSANPLVRTIAIAYLGFFRAVPLLVQLLIWYNLGTFFPRLGIGIPFTDIGLYGATNDLLPPITACLVAIGLNQAAYMGEIIRGGLISVQPGQIEAATALGMTRTKAFRRVIAPQAARSIIPPLGNDTINLLKATSLVSIVGVGDLMTRAQGIYATNYQVIPLLIVASIWYLALTAIISIVQGLLERRLSIAHIADRNAIPLLDRLWPRATKRQEVTP
ncbi:amino acid ABC transporter permease [Devosia sp. ZB163]|uniref:amino acid ABC transporter permease n=1 Tax=Devosia sp. ZB163 TaxID=3025938 RepID=UPI00236304CC|nr:amino acid ABC transporter permease [Devosia sp. ZB163]MDC9826247.1 amino acid ABC transporter permease [Devosia sp. ZB163]